MPLSPVVMFNIIFHFCQRILDHLDKAPATGGAAAEADNHVPLGMIVRDGQDLAIGAETIDSSLDHLVGSLALARVQDLDFRFR